MSVFACDHVTCQIEFWDGEPSPRWCNMHDKTKWLSRNGLPFSHLPLRRAVGMDVGMDDIDMMMIRCLGCMYAPFSSFLGYVP